MRPALLVALLIGPCAALAQTAPPPGAPNAIPERIEPPAGGPPTGGGVPRSGVIAPPGVPPMPQAAVPDPTPNSTPVISPPGSPGGNPTVQPR